LFEEALEYPSGHNNSYTQYPKIWLRNEIFL